MSSHALTPTFILEPELGQITAPATVVLDQTASGSNAVKFGHVPTWNLAWSDEFNAPAGSPVDQSKWSFETGAGGWGNDELQNYTNTTNNAVQDGYNLVITARQEPTGITSARLVTNGKFSFQYGAIETRAYTNTYGPGFWPAFWMLGDNIGSVGWPQSGEIDAMEWVSRDPNRIFGTLHGPSYSGGTSYGKSFDLGTSFNRTWHTYRVEWQPNRIEWFLDGNSYFVATSNDPQIHGAQNWVYDHNFFIILNMAVGGNFGGNIDGSTAFPSNFIVDYVRVFKFN